MGEPSNSSQNEDNAAVTTGSEFIPVERMIAGMVFWEQYAATVIDYTSKCNMKLITSYSPENIVGKCVKYPSFGDSPDTYMLKTYGKWWQERIGHQKQYNFQEIDKYSSEDYITIGFETPVMPRDVCIYETYNPGAVVRIWGRLKGSDWKLLWEGPPQIHAEYSRKFHPSIKKYNCLMNEIRLEFNHTYLKYHTAIDAVLLAGFRPTPVCSLLHCKLLEEDILNWNEVKKNPDSQTATEEECKEVIIVNPDMDYFSKLPYEVILHIFKNLDLKSLSRSAQVNHVWYQTTLDSCLYQNLSLKRYWHILRAASFVFFKKRCHLVKKLDLSWCGNHDVNFQAPFLDFLQDCCQQLTHLSLSHCNFLDDSCFLSINSLKDLTELRLRNTNSELVSFHHLANLRKLVTVDLGMTNINDEAIIKILQANKELLAVNLDFCEGVQRLDNIIDTCTMFNKKLKSWSSFKVISLSNSGAALFARCVELEELDLGWCLFTHPGNCLEQIALGCSNLGVLNICCWRGLNDQMIMPLINHCNQIRQLDLLGIKNISVELCERALTQLPKLQLVDISYCDAISCDQVANWRQAFPSVVIQQSCYNDTDAFN